MTASAEKKSKRNEQQRIYREAIYNIEFAIKRFHEIVNQGPLYVCTCCDQLWYKHSVSSTDKLRQSNNDISKYLLNRTSVSNKEWVCRTCSSYLMKNKVPLCATANGMAFQDKPDIAPVICQQRSQTNVKVLLTTDKLMFGYIEKLKLHRLEKEKKKKLHRNVTHDYSKVNDKAAL